MGIFLLVSALGVLNLARGYALAVYLGRAPLGKTGNGRSGAIGRAAQGPRRKRQTASPSEAAPPAVPDAASDPEPDAIALDKFRRFVATSGSSLADFAARLKKSARGNDHKSGWTFVAELQGICQPYMERLKQASQRLADEIGDDVQGLVLEQLAQLETTLSNLQYMDFGSNPSEAIERLSQETANTLSMTRSLQKTLEPVIETDDPTAIDETPQSSKVEPAVPNRSQQGVGLAC
jgi:hypothetical protein